MIDMKTLFNDAVSLQKEQEAKALYAQIVALQTAAKASTGMYLRPGSNGMGVLIGEDKKERISLQDAVKYGYLTSAFQHFPTLCQNLDGVKIPDMEETAESAFLRTLADFEVQQNAHKEILSHQIQAKTFTGLYLRPNKTGEWVLTDMNGVEIPLENAVEKGMVSEDILKVPDFAARIPDMGSSHFYLSDKVIEKDQDEAERKTVRDIVDALDYARRSSYYRQVVEQAGDVKVVETKDGRLSFVPNNPAKPVELPQEEWATLAYMHQFASGVKVPANVQKQYDDACASRVAKRVAEITAQQQARQPQNINVHIYAGDVYKHANKTIALHIRNKRAKSADVAAVRANIKAMEEQGLLPKGVDAEGNVCSNSDVYTYKMLQAKLLYHPEMVAYKTQGKTLSRVKDGTIADKLGGNHREAWKILSNPNATPEMLQSVAGVVSGVENFISVKGQATAAVRVAGHKMSYNRNALAGYEEGVVTVPAKEAKTVASGAAAEVSDTGSLMSRLATSEGLAVEEKPETRQTAVKKSVLNGNGQVINLDDYRYQADKAKAQNG